MAAFLADADARLQALACSILDGSAPSGQQRQFVVHDPKRRTITAACFADRVLHHAVLNLAEPRFEAALVPTAFACRQGLGVHAAVVAVQRGLQRHAWVVQVDVAGYFLHIDHAVLLDLLARRFKGADFLALLRRIVEDDMVWFCENRAAANDSLAALRQHLALALHLQLKPGVVLRPAAQGLHFCGYRIKPGVVLASSRKLSRYRSAMHRLQAAEQAGVPQPLLQRAHDVNRAALLPAQTLAWRRQLWWGAPVGLPACCL